MKAIISFSVLIMSTIGGWLGQLIGHGSFLGGWSLALSVVGGLAGVWLGYYVGSNWLG